MTAQHTPGPWFVDEDSRPGMSWNRHIYTKTERATAICFMAHSNGRNEAGDRANARLIAAAPDLLEALQAAVACGMVPISSVSEGGASKHSRQVQVADMIRAAIQKATKEQV